MVFRGQVVLIFPLYKPVNHKYVRNSFHFRKRLSQGPESFYDGIKNVIGLFSPSGLYSVNMHLSSINSCIVP